jgi:hypothetical protein
VSRLACRGSILISCATRSRTPGLPRAVGIIALVDEATGYQKVREKQALQLKLQAFIAEDMQEWAKLFPDEFWLV